MDHALVLLHGFPEHWWAWRDVLPTLAESTSRVFALDLRGFGTSDLTRGDCDLQQMANDVIGVVRALGVASFSVAGIGIGGTVAWMIGALAPLELRSIAVLSAPHPGSASSPSSAAHPGRVAASCRGASLCPPGASAHCDLAPS